MKISETSLLEIKSIDILDVSRNLGLHISNKKTLCPFHYEKTPSMSFKYNKFKCFGCGACGDTISLVMQIKGLAFIEAVDFLGNAYGIDVIKIGNNKQEDSKHDYANQLLLKSNEWFISNMNKSDGRHAKEFLNNRGIYDEQIRRSLLGFSTTYADFSKIFDQKDLSFLKNQCGMNNISSFNSRITIPIFSENNKIVGFSFRSLIKDETQNKYINTGNSFIFEKKKILFGMHIAKEFCKKEGFIIIVEGPLDVIALNSINIFNVVAVQGSSFSEEHALILKKYNIDKAVLFFDGDITGVKCTINTSKILIMNEIAPFVFKTPSGHDPGSLVLNNNLKSLTCFDKLLTNQNKNVSDSMYIILKKNIVDGIYVILKMMYIEHCFVKTEDIQKKVKTIEDVCDFKGMLSVFSLKKLKKSFTTLIGTLNLKGNQYIEGLVSTLIKEIIDNNGVIKYYSDINSGNEHLESAFSFGKKNIIDESDVANEMYHVGNKKFLHLVICMTLYDISLDKFKDKIDALIGNVRVFKSLNNPERELFKFIFDKKYLTKVFFSDIINYSLSNNLKWKEMIKFMESESQNIDLTTSSCEYFFQALLNKLIIHC